MKRKRPLSTNERLLASFDVIRYELDRMGIAILDATMWRRTTAPRCVVRSRTSCDGRTRSWHAFPRAGWTKSVEKLERRVRRGHSA